MTNTIEAKVVIGGIYRHYKGRELPMNDFMYSYKIIAVGDHTESDEKVVIYQQLYDKDEYFKGHTWVRPLNGEKGFLTPEKIDGKDVSRFVLVVEPPK